MTSKQKWAFIGILLIAIFFRFYQIKAMPGGLFPDEAANGIDVIAMQRGNIQPFYEGNNGRESLFFFMLWGSVEVFGKGLWQHHIVSAFVGLISVLACFLVTRELFSIFYDGTSDQDKERIEKQSIYFALLPFFFMAASAWHTVLSRTAFRANLIPLFAAFTFYFLILAFKVRAKNKRCLYYALTGIAFVLGFYSYIAYRIMILLVAIAIVWPILVDIFSSPRFNRTKKFITPAVICSAVFAIFIAPLAYYFYMHPRSFVGRSGQVSIFNPDLNHGDLFGTFVKVFLKSVSA